VNLPYFSEALMGEWIATLSLVVSVLVFRGLLARFVRDSQVSADVRRRWLVQVRTGAVLTLLFGLVVIWAQELRTVAFSLVAVAVALTIATKELLLCLSGALLRTSSRAFSVGDRVQIGSFRGDVIDIGALSTKVLEVDDATNRRTGRAITVPNSMFLDKPTLNETFAASYVLSVLTVPLPKGADWTAHEQVLLHAAIEECRPFLEEAKAQIKRSSRLEVLDAPVVDPTVSLLLDKAEEVRLQLRFPAPVRRSHRVAQAILKRYLVGRPAPAKAEPVKDEEEREHSHALEEEA
jgi:small-conductance mechanosensitive channel